jgi:CheY-like chemotaxis protein
MLIEHPIALLADDLEDNAILLRIVLERAGWVHPLQYVRDGVEAIEYLRGDGMYRDRARFPLPAFLLLDLNMPRKDGFEVLAWIREQPALRPLPVYVFSASSQAEDIRRSYALGANAYLVKPGNLDGLMNLAATLLAWFKVRHFAPPADEDTDQVPARLPASAIYAAVHPPLRAC